MELLKKSKKTHSVNSAVNQRRVCSRRVFLQQPGVPTGSIINGRGDALGTSPYIYFPLETPGCLKRPLRASTNI